MELTTDEIQTVLADYGLAPPQDVQRCSQGYANFNFRVAVGSQVVLYRVCDSQSLENTQRETQLNRYLHEKGLPVPAPIPRVDGQYITPSPSGPVVLYPFVDGHTPDHHPEVVRAIAQAAARLHQLPCPPSLEKPNTVGVDAAKQFIAKTAAHPQPERFAQFVHAFNAIQGDLDKLEDRVLVHGDLFRDNTLFKGHELVAILDFEEYCLESRMFELGVLVNGFCSPDNRPDPNLIRVLLEGYQTVTPLRPEELERLPAYSRWGALCMIFWHLNALLDSPDPRKLVAIDGHFARLEQMHLVDKSL